MKRGYAIVQGVFGALAIGLIALSLTGAGGMDYEDKWIGGDSLMTVAGDSVTYYITHHILPGARDTTEAFDTRECDRLQIGIFGSGDSLSYYAEYSIDKTNWYQVTIGAADSVDVNATESTDYPPTTASWNTIAVRQLEHSPNAIGAATRAIVFDDWMLPWLRVCVINRDLSDTLINARVRIMCGK